MQARQPARSTARAIASSDHTAAMLARPRGCAGAPVSLFTEWADGEPVAGLPGGTTARDAGRGRAGGPRGRPARFSAPRVEATAPVELPGDGRGAALGRPARRARAAVPGTADAARAGTSGDSYGTLDAIAWYGENSGGRTHPVGQKMANAWGLWGDGSATSPRHRSMDPFPPAAGPAGSRPARPA